MEREDPDPPRVRFAGREVQALLFDLDGTLIDSADDLLDSVTHAFRAVDVDPPPRARLQTLLGSPLEEMPGALGLDFDAALMQRFFRAFRAHYPEHWLDRTTTYPGVPEGLDRLASRLPLALVTTKRQVQAERLCRALGLDGALRHIQGWQPGLRHKPAPDLPLAALEALRVPPANAVMIGDTDRDVLAGRAAGCAVVAVGYGAGNPRKLRDLSPDAIVRDFAALLRLFAPDVSP